MGSYAQRGEYGGPPIQKNLEDMAANVVRVHVDGIGRTKESLVMSNLASLFQVKHFEDLVVSAEEVRGKLRGISFVVIRLPYHT